MVEKSKIAPNVVTFACLANSYAQKKDLFGALQIVQRSQQVGVRPDLKFLNGVLGAFEPNMARQALEFVETMQGKYGVTPDFLSYVQVVNLFVKLGDSGKVQQLLLRMEDLGLVRDDGWRANVLRAVNLPQGFNSSRGNGGSDQRNANAGFSSTSTSSFFGNAGHSSASTSSAADSSMQNSRTVSNSSVSTPSSSSFASNNAEAKDAPNRGSVHVSPTSGIHVSSGQISPASGIHVSSGQISPTSGTHVSSGQNQNQNEYFLNSSGGAGGPNLTMNNISINSDVPIPKSVIRKRKKHSTEEENTRRKDPGFDNFIGNSLTKSDSVGSNSKMSGSSTKFEIPNLKMSGSSSVSTFSRNDRIDHSDATSPGNSNVSDGSSMGTIKSRKPPRRNNVGHLDPTIPSDSGVGDLDFSMDSSSAFNQNR